VFACLESCRGQFDVAGCWSANVDYLNLRIFEQILGVAIGANVCHVELGRIWIASHAGYFSEIPIQISSTWITEGRPSDVLDFLIGSNVSESHETGPNDANFYHGRQHIPNPSRGEMVYPINGLPSNGTDYPIEGQVIYSMSPFDYGMGILTERQRTRRREDLIETLCSPCLCERPSCTQWRDRSFIPNEPIRLRDGYSHGDTENTEKRRLDRNSVFSVPL
jgi:hypothetical protein